MYNDWMAYSNLLIDKFAIHSLSFFHLSQGIVERRSNDTVKKTMGYDLFSVNSLFRVMMETYIAFNWIFVAPETDDEKEFRFLLWKLDGLLEKRKFDYTEEMRLEMAESLQKDLTDKQATIERLKVNTFYRLLSQQEIERVFDISKNKAIWKYELKQDYKLRPLKITELIQITCRIDAFLNMYRYTSLYAHSNYTSVDKFRQMRGQLVSDDYAQPLLKLAIFLTTLVIDDMCLTDQNSRRAFGELEPHLQRSIIGMSSQIKKTPVRLAK
jgi:hypothetical protein